MVPKVLLLVCLVPLVMGSPEEFMKMMMMSKMMEKGGEMGGRSEEMGGRSEERGGRSGEMGGRSGEMEEHFAGDGDCKSEAEAMKKKFQMWQNMQKMQEMMEKKKKMEEGMEKMKKFKMFMEMMKKKKMMEEMEQKKKMMEMYEKHQEMKRKQEKEGEFKELIESFTMQKHKFAFSLTHHFLTMCKCGQIDYQMNKMFMGEKMGNSSGMAEGMDDGSDLMDAWQSGDMATVAKKVKMMPKEEQKKMYMSGLIKSMCTGARSFINYAAKFEAMYMKDDDKPTTTDPFKSS